jgi:hypothetical protein
MKYQDKIRIFREKQANQDVSKEVGKNQERSTSDRYETVLNLCCSWRNSCLNYSRSCFIYQEKNLCRSLFNIKYINKQTLLNLCCCWRNSCLIYIKVKELFCQLETKEKDSKVSRHSTKEV